MDIMKLFTTILLVQLFYGLSVTLMVHSMDGLTGVGLYADPFTETTETIDLNGTIGNVQSSLESQTKLPLIEVGAILFYSGNILIDLLLNFAFAIPQMIGFVVYGLTSLFDLPSFLTVTIQAFASGIIMLLYFISLIQILLNLRSGQRIT